MTESDLSHIGIVVDAKVVCEKGNINSTIKPRLNFAEVAHDAQPQGFG
jgi:hypothetical protein